MSANIECRMKLMDELGDIIKIPKEAVTEILDTEGNMYDSIAYNVKILPSNMVAFYEKGIFKLIPLSRIKEINFICPESSQLF